jgi:di/tricarboxylate transporter
MNTDQMILFALLAGVFIFLIWGRWRYDIVAFMALIIALIVGIVPSDQAFSGFGHPATVIVALVLIISRGLSNSGAIELIARYLVDSTRSLSAHISVMATLVASLSALMNNVGALALLMPVDMQAAEKAKRSPALTLMPLSFASILGGMITLIGTPPNIIIAAYREQALGEAFSMFDFAPVGLATAVVGVIFIATIGWRLIPTSSTDRNSAQELYNLEGYIAEAKVPETSSIIGKRVNELDELSEENGVAIIGVVRRGQRLPGMARRQVLKKNDILVLEASPAALEKFIGAAGLNYAGADKHGGGLLGGGNLSLVEVVVPEGARIEGRSSLSVRLLYRHAVTLLGVSRQGQRFRDRVRDLEIEAGDVLLLIGPTERLPEIINWLGCLPLAERGLHLVQRQKALLAVGLFGTAIALASFGFLYLPVALAATAGLMVLFEIVPLHQVYDAVEWPVIVLLGSMIPIGGAMETTGATALIANGIVDISVGYSAAVVLTLLIVVTMTLSDLLNNTATAIIMAPIAISIANSLNVSPDPFLMAVAIAASCAFLTPIGHKNNTLIMGPGGYKFGDYWRMGLPLEILVIVISVPMLLWVWPF